jgi:hypothetical protein
MAVAVLALMGAGVVAKVCSRPVASDSAFGAGVLSEPLARVA